jgi:hypothetical protein
VASTATKTNRAIDVNMAEVPSIRDQIPEQTQENSEEIGPILFDTPAALQANPSRCSLIRRCA